jgi:hypothetical protein
MMFGFAGKGVSAAGRAPEKIARSDGTSVERWGFIVWFPRFYFLDRVSSLGYRSRT